MTFVFGTDLRSGPRDTKDTISRVPRPPQEQLIFFQSYIYIGLTSWFRKKRKKEKKERNERFSFEKLRMVSFFFFKSIKEVTHVSRVKFVLDTVVNLPFNNFQVLVECRM